MDEDTTNLQISKTQDDITESIIEPPTAQKQPSPRELTETIETQIASPQKHNVEETEEKVLIPPPENLEDSQQVKKSLKEDSDEKVEQKNAKDNDQDYIEEHFEQEYV